MNTILHAIAEPSRLRIVELLRTGPHSVGEIADKLGIRQPQVSKHLRILSESGLVEVSPIGNQRIYRLCPQPFKELDDWSRSFRRIWDERFDQLDDYLHALQEKGQEDDE